MSCTCKKVQICTHYRWKHLPFWWISNENYQQILFSKTIKSSGNGDFTRFPCITCNSLIPVFLSIVTMNLLYSPKKYANTVIKEFTIFSSAFAFPTKTKDIIED